MAPVKPFIVFYAMPNVSLQIFYTPIFQTDLKKKINNFVTQLMHKALFVPTNKARKHITHTCLLTNR